MMKAIEVVYCHWMEMNESLSVFVWCSSCYQLTLCHAIPPLSWVYTDWGDWPSPAPSRLTSPSTVPTPTPPLQYNNRCCPTLAAWSLLTSVTIPMHWTREVFRDETGYICLSTWAFGQLKISFYQAFTWKNGQMTLNGLAAFHPSLVMDSGYSCWMMWQKVSGQPHPSSLHYYCIEIQWIPLVINGGDYFRSPLTSLSQTPPLSYSRVFNLPSQWTSSSTQYVSIERRKVCHLLRFSFTKLHHIITTYHITIYFYVWT